ncbi:MAG: L,D-transpeptidase [Thermoleophilaceae bacterium]
MPTPSTASAVARTAADAVRRARARAVPAAEIVRVDAGATVAVHARPGGPVALRAGDATELGLSRALGVVARRGRWLGVTTPELPNGRLGWIDRRAGGVTLARTRWSIVVDVSNRTTTLRRAGRAVHRLPVAVGRPGSPTPTGRFAVTDKLPGSRYGPYYGCCILAISATQPNLPPGWTGGDRMAIHGTDDAGSIGEAASAGCLRAADDDLRVLMDSVPLGTPVTIRR